MLIASNDANLCVHILDLNGECLFCVDKVEGAALKQGKNIQVMYIGICISETIDK